MTDLEGARRQFLFLLCSVMTFAVLAAGCGGGSGGGSSVSAASFCSSMDSFTAQYKGLGSSLAPPSKTKLASAASQLQKLESSAPSAVKSDMGTEAGAFGQWAKNGDDTAVQSSAFSTADQKILDWHQANCK